MNKKINVRKKCYKCLLLFISAAPLAQSFNSDCEVL